MQSCQNRLFWYVGKMSLHSLVHHFCWVFFWWNKILALCVFGFLWEHKSSLLWTQRFVCVNVCMTLCCRSTLPLLMCIILSWSSCASWQRRTPLSNLSIRLSAVRSTPEDTHTQTLNDAQYFIVTTQGSTFCFLTIFIEKDLHFSKGVSNVINVAPLIPKMQLKVLYKRKKENKKCKNTLKYINQLKSNKKCLYFLKW